MPSDRAFEVIILLQSIYLCEAGFSSVLTTKQNIDLE